MQTTQFRPGIRTWLAIVLVIGYGIAWGAFQPQQMNHARVMDQFDPHATALITDTSRLDRLNRGWAIIGILSGTLIALDFRRRGTGNSVLIALASGAVGAVAGAGLTLWVQKRRNRKAAQAAGPQAAGQEDRYENR